jgi:hypothetical protein
LKPCYPECVSLQSLVIGLLLAPVCFAQTSPLLDILQQELQRNYSELKKKADPAPYFLGYSVVEQQSEVITGALGTLQSRTKSHGRYLDLTVRVGSPPWIITTW